MVIECWSMETEKARNYSSCTSFLFFFQSMQAFEQPGASFIYCFITVISHHGDRQISTNILKVAVNG